MNVEAKSNLPAAGLPAPPVKPDAEPAKLSKLPGLIAISLYMLLLAGIMIVRVATGAARPLMLIFPVFFVAAALGMLLLLRWAWALTLAAVALSAGSFLWSFTTQHIAASLLQGLLNLVFFLYLVRTDVRKNLH
ncbi:MAG: hypothetical protein ABSA42_08575 [Terracidiphilus sp.]|jgi:hypothetical protein